MAALATALKTVNDSNNARTYAATATHTVDEPRLIIHKRRIATGSQKILEDVLSVVCGTEDADGNPHPNKILFEVKMRRPMDAIAADVTDAKVLLRDVVQSTELDDVIDKQYYLKD